MHPQKSPDSTVQYLARPGKPALAYVYTQSAGEGKKYPLVMFCGGYRSDMNGTKATYLENQCKSRGQAYLRFDYSGHGLSEGEFADGTIGSWKQDALDILNHVCSSGPVVLVGSSMGGWIVLLVAQDWQGPIKGLVGIAAAPDFTEDIYGHLNEAQKNALLTKGSVNVLNDYSNQPYEFARDFYQEAKNHLLLDRPRHVDFPLRLIQGLQDKDVPLQKALEIQQIYQGDVEITRVEGGDHRLSRPQDLELIDRQIRSLCGLPG